MNLGRYNKFLTAVAGVVVSWLLRHYGAVSWVYDVELLLTAAGVYLLPNQSVPPVDPTIPKAL